MKRGKSPYESWVVPNGVPPEGESRWERLLGELGLSEDGLWELLEGGQWKGDVRAMTVVLWARKHSMRAFVPVRVLDKLGLWGF